MKNWMIKLPIVQWCWTHSRSLLILGSSSSLVCLNIIAGLSNIFLTHLVNNLNKLLLTPPKPSISHLSILTALSEISLAPSWIILGSVVIMKTLNTSVNMCSAWILKGLPYYLLSFWSMYLLSVCYLNIIFMTQLLKYLLSSFLSLSNCPRKKRHLDLLDSFWNGALRLGIML